MHVFHTSVCSATSSPEQKTVDFCPTVYVLINFDHLPDAVKASFKKEPSVWLMNLSFAHYFCSCWQIHMFLYVLNRQSRSTAHSKEWVSVSSWCWHLYVLPKALNISPVITKASAQPLLHPVVFRPKASVALLKCHVSSPYFPKTFPYTNKLEWQTKDQVKTPEVWWYANPHEWHMAVRWYLKCYNMQLNIFRYSSHVA